MSTSTTKQSKAATLAQLQALIAGLQQQLPKGTFTLVSTAYTTATLVTALQGVITALTNLDAAQAGAKAALVAWKAEHATMGPTVLALKRILQSMYANAPDTLAVFGLKPRKALAPRTAEEKAASAAKAAATRKARGTAGKKQKAAVKGNVTGVTITPVVAPTAVAAQTPASPASTAQPATSQPATSAASASPTGHTGQ
jgi:hypothetical protein